MRLAFFATALLLTPLCASAAHGAKTPTDETTYVRITNERAEKIVAKANIADAAKAIAARDLIGQFYRDLNAIQTARDTAIKAAKADATAAQTTERSARINAARADADTQREAVRTTFVEHLSTLLTPEQVDAVKDGLTYGVAPLTFRVYQEMLPNLTPEQKQQIHAWLLEAREHAIAGFTSEEKHAWFGKYKGRINNYLSKAGYNMKDAEKQLAVQSRASR